MLFSKLPNGCHPELISWPQCPCDAKNSEKMIKYHFFRGKLSQK